MALKKVVLIKSSHFAHVTRIPKEMDTLSREGYLVSFLGWDRDYGSATSRWQRVEKLHKEIKLNFRAPYGAMVLPFLPIWWCFVFFQLMIRDWDIADAMNLDSALPAVIAGKLKRKPVIYEMLDVYQDQILLPRVLRTICLKVERLCARLASSVVVVDELQIEEVGGIPNRNIVTIYESPPDIWPKLDKTNHKDDTFTLFTAGELSAVRRLHLDNVFAAIKELDGVKLVLAGEGDLVGKIREWAHQTPDKIHYIGWIPHYEDVLNQMRTADLLFSLRDPTILTNRYNCGAKLFEAMMCGTALLVSKGTSMAAKVSRENCGLVVNADSIEEIKKAIVRLRDNPELCQEFGANARRAYEQKYAWKIMEQRLVALFQELISEGNDA